MGLLHFPTCLTSRSTISSGEATIRDDIDGMRGFAHKAHHIAPPVKHFQKKLHALVSVPIRARFVVLVLPADAPQIHAIGFKPRFNQTDQPRVVGGGQPQEPSQAIAV